MATQQELFKDTCEENVYFWLAGAGARSQQKHMSKRNFLHEYYSMYFEFLSPPLPPVEVILVNIVCFAQGTQVSFDLPEHWQGSEVQHYSKLLLCN